MIENTRQVERMTLTKHRTSNRMNSLDGGGTTSSARSSSARSGSSSSESLENSSTITPGRYSSTVTPAYLDDQEKPQRSVL